MKIISQEECEIFIIDYLLAHRYIGHKQTTFEIMTRHVPAHDQTCNPCVREPYKKRLYFNKEKTLWRSYFSNPL